MTSDADWSAVVQADRAHDLAAPPTRHRALGLGAPGNGDTAASVAWAEEPAEQERQHDREPPPAPPAPDALQNELEWVKRAVEEVSRAFTRLTTRIGTMESRLDQLEADRHAEPVPARPEPAPALPSPDVERLAARIEQTAERVDSLDGRLRQLDFLPLKVTNVSRAVDQLGRARAEPSPVSAAEVEELRRQLAAAQQRLAAIDTRVSSRSISAAVQAEVRREADRLAAEVPGGPVDLEGLYRELDAVAEFVADRAATTAESLERIGPLEIAVLDLRRELGRAMADFAGAEEGDDVELRLAGIESRLRELEAAGTRIDRLYTALLDIAHVNPDVRPVRNS